MNDAHRTINPWNLNQCLDSSAEGFNSSRLLSPTETSVVLGVTQGTLSVWRSTGRYQLPYVKCGRLVKYKVADILSFLDSRRVVGTDGGSHEK